MTTSIIPTVPLYKTPYLMPLYQSAADASVAGTQAAPVAAPVATDAATGAAATSVSSVTGSTGTLVDATA